MISENMLLSNKILVRLGILLFLLLVVVPFVAAIVYALLYASGSAGSLSTGFTLKYLTKVFTDGEVFISIGYSMYIATTTLLLAATVVFFLIICFRSSLLKGRFSYLVYLPLAFPSLVAGFITLLILGKAGFFSRTLYHLHLINQLESFPGLVNDPFAIGIIITHALMAIPFLLIYFSSLYDSENIRELEMLATNLGSDTWQTTRFIILPMLLKKGFPTLLLYFIFVLGSYEVPLLLGVQSPQMISLLIIRKLQRFNLLDIPQGYCIALLYTFLLMVLLLLFFKSKKTIQS